MSVGTNKELLWIAGISAFAISSNKWECRKSLSRVLKVITLSESPKTLAAVWQKYIETARECEWDDLEKHTTADLDYLYSINANQSIIDAAIYLPGCRDIHWAPTQSMREYTPDMFASSLLVGSDGGSNYYYWLDATRSDSPIVLVSLSPIAILVIANSGVDWLEKRIEAYQTPNFKSGKENVSQNYLSNVGLTETVRKLTDKYYFNGDNDQLGLAYTKNDTITSIDFNQARLGAGVTLDFGGKHSYIETGQVVGVLTIGTLDEDDVKVEGNVKMLIIPSILIGYAAPFLFLYQFQERSLIVSLISSVLWSAIMIPLAMCILAMSYLTIANFFSKRKE